MDWQERAAEAVSRYEDGVSRLPEDPARRERQLLRIATAAGATGLARLMSGQDGAEWFRRSAAAYRESFALAGPGSWGRVVGAVKAGILAGDPGEDAEWALAQVPQGEPSPIAHYALALARLARNEPAPSLVGAPDFPADVAEALAALDAGDAEAYRAAAASVLASFEARESFLEDLPVADTVIVFERLAAERGIAAGFGSPFLP